MSRSRSHRLTPAELAGFRRGDPDAVRAVWQQYGRLVYTVALRTLGSRPLAEDAAQQAFVNAWRNAARYDSGRDLGPWLATITRRVAIDLHRREERRRGVALDELSSLPPGLLAEQLDVDAASDAATVRATVARLPALERDVVRLLHFHDLTHREIAEQLGIPLGTVKSRAHRAQQRLASRLRHLQPAAVSRCRPRSPSPGPNGGVCRSG